MIDGESPLESREVFTLRGANGCRITLRLTPVDAPRWYSGSAEIRVPGFVGGVDVEGARDSLWDCVRALALVDDGLTGTAELDLDGLRIRLIVDRGAIRIEGDAYQDWGSDRVNLSFVFGADQSYLREPREALA